MLEILKDYYVFLLLLMVFSYLVPKEEYKSYIQFFIGIFVVVLFLKPVLEFLNADNSNLLKDIFETMNDYAQKIDVKVEGENIFEHFLFERKE